ncbi:hypothetical protein OH76DRAFT_1484624 [Lentinus brumalis]|uniref:Uncharacterized protein n=1 Tax=Lentinus brumalis TaxID=2498619 RepID=A0A371D4J7_9APHY|nr:hypothetical protein OH76DRAFT_1484624 [Polyporus brumalis]
MSVDCPNRSDVTTSDEEEKLRTKKAKKPRVTSLDAFIDNPTPDKHLITAIRGLRQFVERLAGGKSLDEFFATLRVCGVDFQQDHDVRKWFDEFIAHCCKSLDERDYVRSDEAQKKRYKLCDEWKQLVDKDSDKGRKWKADVAKLKQEATEFQKAVDRDDDLRQIRRTRVKLGEDIENTLLTAASMGAQSLMERAPWFWQDIFNVYLLKGHSHPKVEIVLEDLDISTSALLPSHAYLRNITDIDIKAPSAGQVDTAVGTLTACLRSSAALFTLPTPGVDVDIVIRSIPNSKDCLHERERREGFIDIQRVDVKVSEDIDLTIKQSNHQILVSVFRPVIVWRFRDVLQIMLAQHIRGALKASDVFAHPVELQ